VLLIENSAHRSGEAANRPRNRGLTDSLGRPRASHACPDRPRVVNDVRQAIFDRGDRGAGTGLPTECGWQITAVDDVDVEMDVDTARMRVLQRGAHRRRIRDRSPHSAHLQRVALGVVEIPRADQQRALIGHRSQTQRSGDDLRGTPGDHCQ
jgi:hypothetical protein